MLVHLIELTAEVIGLAGSGLCVGEGDGLYVQLLAFVKAVVELSRHGVTYRIVDIATGKAHLDDVVGAGGLDEYGREVVLLIGDGLILFACELFVSGVAEVGARLVRECQVFCASV